MEQHAEGGKRINIQSASFLYEFLREPEPNESGVVVEGAPRASIPEAIKLESKALTDQLSAIRSDLKIVGVAVIVAAAVFLFRGHFF